MATAHNLKTLDAWRLCRDLKREIFAFTATGPASRDFDFRDQIRSAATSAPDNVAEGFYRFRPKEFARFCLIARGSLGEVQSQLEHAKEQNYLTAQKFEEIMTLSHRAIGCVTRLHGYLRTCKPR